MKKTRFIIALILFFVLVLSIFLRRYLYYIDFTRISRNYNWNSRVSDAIIEDNIYELDKRTSDNVLLQITIQEGELFIAGPRLVILIQVHLPDKDKPMIYQLRVDKDGLMIKPPETLMIIEEMLRKGVFDSKKIPKRVQKQIAVIIMNHKDQKLDKHRFI